MFIVLTLTTTSNLTLQTLSFSMHFLSIIAYIPILYNLDSHIVHMSQHQPLIIKQYIVHPL
jgi:hypothetical protein